MLGEGCVRLTYPTANLLQGLRENIDFVTMEEGMCTLTYHKEEVSMCAAGPDDALTAIGIFPQPPVWLLPATAKQVGGSRCDVWTATVDLSSIRAPLEKHANGTMDLPIPRYQMVVDPNLFVQEGPSGLVWIPCEFDIEEA